MDVAIPRDGADVVGVVGGVQVTGLCQRDPSSIGSTPVPLLVLGGGNSPVDATVGADGGTVSSNGAPVAPLSDPYLDGLVRTGSTPFGHFTLRLVRFDGTHCSVQGRITP